MPDQKLTILAVGATGSIGGHVVDKALRLGHKVRAFVRDPGKLKERPGLYTVVGDLTIPQSLPAAIDG